MATDARPAAPQGHSVLFYDRDSDLVAQLAQFSAEGIARGEQVLVFATAEHRSALDEVLVQYRLDPAQARHSGDYRSFDAAETLAEVLAGGQPGPAQFDRIVGGLLNACTGTGRPVRVFGEMVALLCAADRVESALALESLWNRLGQRRPFSLLCAYPQRCLDQGTLFRAGELCRQHGEVMPPRSYTAPAAPNPLVSGPAMPPRSSVFVPVPAVEHAASPFRVAVYASEARLRITVEDVAPEPATLRRAGPHDFNGRGISIVAQLASSWGCEPVPGGGKVVWAELAA